MDKRNYFTKIKPEYIILVLLAATCLAVYHLKYFEYILLSVSAFIGALLFIIFNRFFANNELTLNSPQLSESRRHTLRLSLSILFFIFYGLSFLALLQGFYTKTASYYVFIALCAGLIAIDILFVNTRAQGHLNLLKSFLLVLNITLSNQVLFPYGIGFPDSNYHIFGFVIPVVNSGHIPLAGTYSDFPCHHILVAANSLISGIDPRMLYYCLGGFVMSLGLFFVFLIGRKFVNLKFGLLAALIYVCCDYLMSGASHPSHMSYTYFLAVAIFAITLYMYHKRDPRFVVLFIILCTAIIFAHHLSAAVILIMLAAMLFVELINYMKARDYEFKLHGLAALFWVALFAQWMYFSGTIGVFAGIIEAYHSAFTQEAAASIALTSIFRKLPLGNLFLNEIGSVILVMLSTIGFLHFFKHSSSFKKFVIALVVTFVLLISVEILMKKSYLEPARMYSFMQEFSLVFLASCAIIWMLNNFKKLKPLLIILVICLCFFSLASLIHGEETGLFKGDRAYRKLYETPYERYSAKWGEQYISTDSSITKSWSFRTPLSNLPGDRFPISEVKDPLGRGLLIIDSQGLAEGTFIIFSQFDIDIGFRYETRTAKRYYMGGGTYAKIDERVVYPLDRHNKLYNNGIVSVYYTGD